MLSISKPITEYLALQLSSGTGVNSLLEAARAENTRAPGDIRLITTLNIAPELMERSNQAHYPCLLVYCEKLSNTFREKFRMFSGTARMTVELRASGDRLDSLTDTLTYTDSICSVLDTLRGEWEAGAYYAGGYEVSYAAAKPGGKHFLQIAKISFEISISQ